MSKKGIYKFNADCGRGGYLNGIFIETSDRVEKIIGRTVYFGEVLGKHSDVEIDIEAGNIELASDRPEDIEVVERLDLNMGYNPFDYIDEDELGEDEEDDD